MSQKGKTFELTDAPRSVKNKEAWANEQTERNRIVARDRGERPDRQPIIAEELTQRTINRLKSPKARRAVAALLRLTTDERLEVITAFAANGSLKNPFTPTK